MQKSEFLVNIKSDLGTNFLESEIERSFIRAVDDCNKYLPAEKIAEFTIQSSQSLAQEWTDLTATVQLVKPIKLDSVVVTRDSDSVIMTEDTDYSVDYQNGILSVISTGIIAISTDYTITYELNLVALDISSLTDLTRIVKVEYPAGRVPQQFPSYTVFGGLLYIGSPGEKQSQSGFTNGYKVNIMYEALHTIPDIGETTLPVAYSGMLAVGASAYALIQKALQCRLLSMAELALVTSGLSAGDPQTISFTTTESDLNRIHGITIDNSDINSAIAIIQGFADDVVTKIGLAGFNALITSATAPSLTKYLGDGDALIETNNDGKDVPENYARFAEACVNGALAISKEADILAQVVNGISSIANAAASGVSAQANSQGNYALEAQGRHEINKLKHEMNRIKIDVSNQHVLTSERYYTLSDIIMKDGESKRQDFLQQLTNRRDSKRKSGSSLSQV